MREKSHINWLQRAAARSARGLPGRIGVIVAATAAQGAYIDHNFDGLPLGTRFTNEVQQWRASSASVVVSDAEFVSPGHSVWLPPNSAISNAVAVGGPTVVWTVTRTRPRLGIEPLYPPTNGVSYLHYFGTNGFLNVWNGSGWQACSNDVWDAPAPAFARGDWVDVAIYQNFTNRTTAVMVDGRVVLQDFPFVNALSDYGTFTTENVVSNAYLDDVAVQTAYPAGRPTEDANSDGLTDAEELQQYGYVSRTLYVGAGERYATIAAALAVARDRDTVFVRAGNYSDTATISANIRITGETFSNSGTLTVAAGKTVTVGHSFSSSLSVSGTLSLSAGVTVTAASAAVAGTGKIDLAASASLLAGTLTVAAGGEVASTGGRLSVADAGVDMTGTFTVDDAWGTQAERGLDFAEDFELYADGSQLASLGFRGWGASSTTNAVVRAGQGRSGTKAALVTDGAVLSNRINTAQMRVWTDYYLRPRPGLAPASPPTDRAAYAGYVNTAGRLAVWEGAGWVVCSNDVAGGALPALGTSAYTRVTVHCDYVNHRSAVFVANRLAREQIPFPAGEGIGAYHGLVTDNRSYSAGLDDLAISAAMPGGMTNDVDRDTMADALEIDRYGTLGRYNGPWTFFLFR